jgi:hypothetical protein
LEGRVAVPLIDEEISVPEEVGHGSLFPAFAEFADVGVGVPKGPRAGKGEKRVR